MSILKSIVPLAAGIMLLMAGGQLAYSQGGEVGFGGGGSFYTEKTVTAPAGNAKAGFETGFAASGWIGQNLYKYIGGEVRYLFGVNDMKLNADGTKTTFGGRSHSIHYNLLFHMTPLGAKVRPFVAVGGGIKGYYGVGEETAAQPGQDYAVLTHTSDWKGLVVFGGGIKFAVSKSVYLRAEFYDYLTPMPTKVISPAPGAELSGWIHDFVPMFGVSFTF